jgi:hypothetical protein
MEPYELRNIGRFVHNHENCRTLEHDLHTLRTMESKSKQSITLRAIGPSFKSSLTVRALEHWSIGEQEFRNLENNRKLGARIVNLEYCRTLN